MSDVLAILEGAFANARMPRTRAELATDGLEGPYVHEHFFGKTREQLESSPFPGSLYMEDFTYMTTAAVRYYLPSVLRIMLATNDDELWIFLSSFLKNAAFDQLDPAQRTAVASVIETLAARWASDGDPKAAKKALALAGKYRAG